MSWLLPSIHPAAVLHGGRPITDVIAADLAKAIRISERGRPQLEEHINYVIPGNPIGIEKAYENGLKWLEYWNEHASLISVDVETSSLEYFNCRMYSIALAEADSGVAVAFTGPDFHTLPPHMERGLLAGAAKILANPKITKVYHNSPFDRAVISRKQFKIAGPTMDTVGLAHIIQPDAPKDLGWVGHTYLECEPWKLDHESGKMANTKDPVSLLIYNGRDALYTAYCVEPMVNTIFHRGMSADVIAWQMAFAELSTAMEIRGCPINLPLRRLIGKKLLEELGLTKRKLRQILRWDDFNPMSQDHRIELLYGRKYGSAPWNLGLIPTRFTKKTQAPSTSYKAIIDHMENPVVALLVKYIEGRHTFGTLYREGQPDEEDDLAVAEVEGAGDDDADEEELPDRSAGVENFFKQVVAAGIEGIKRKRAKVKDKMKPGAFQRAMCEDGRLHCKVNPTGQTGSRSSTSPNNQNLKEDHRIWMEVKDGRAIIYADKDQLELRLVSVRAGIEALLKVMRDPNGDPHMMSARSVYGEEFDRRPKKDQKNIRKVTKNVMYAGTYLAGWETVWRTCRENKRIDPELRAMMTKELVRFTHAQLFRKLYRGIGRFHERELQKVCQLGYMEIPPIGWRRYAPIVPPDATEFANWSIQPVGSHIVKMEMCRVEWELQERFHGSAGVFLDGHDSLAVECDLKDAEAVQEIVQRHFGCTRMDGPAGPVDLTATADIGTNLLSILGKEQQEKAEKIYASVGWRKAA